VTLADWRDYWENSLTLQALLPINKVFLDFVPPGTAYPYGRFTIISQTRIDTTGGGDDSHIEVMVYQLSLFDTNLDDLCTLTDSIMLELDNARLTDLTMRNRRTNKFTRGEVLDGVYTYHGILQYEWTSNANSESP
jgi:hypothetical protein